jgi:magnesium transporter
VQILTTLDPDVIAGLRARHEFFWLDLVAPSDADVRTLGDTLALHPLAVEDTLHFGQRPKLDVYDEQALLVLQGGVVTGSEAAEPHPLTEIHCYISGDFVVTVHRDEFAELARLRTELHTSSAARSEQYYVYRIIDTVVDSFFPVLSGLDDEINDLEDAIIDEPSKAELIAIFKLKRLLLKLRKAVIPMRDLFAREIETIADLAGLDTDSHGYFRDVYDHLIRISDLLDSYHDLVSGCTDLYLSNVANRQGEISKQLTVVASIFLPLSFLTGLFGVNFGWFVDHVLPSETAFWVLGVGSMLASAAAMWAWFKHKGWIGED